VGVVGGRLAQSMDRAEGNKDVAGWISEGSGIVALGLAGSLSCVWVVEVGLAGSIDCAGVVRVWWAGSMNCAGPGETQVATCLGSWLGPIKKYIYNYHYLPPKSLCIYMYLRMRFTIWVYLTEDRS
jgi:hypothetical protein